MDFTGGNGQGQEQMFFWNIFPFCPPFFQHIPHFQHLRFAPESLDMYSLPVPCNV